MTKPTWFDRWQIASSRWLNVVLGGRFDEMLSSRLNRERHWAESLVDLLFWAATGLDHHCRVTREWENRFRDTGQ
jgi:hypothetical protein